MFYNPFQKNKTPGNDGLTKELYVAFWSLIGKPLVDCTITLMSLENFQTHKNRL